VNTAEVTYLNVSGGKYGTIQDLVRAELLDSRFEDTVGQYKFYVKVSGEDYYASAFPATKKAGRYGYFSTADAVVRYATEKAPMCEPCFPDGQSGAPVQ
jgi:hypothetical protein